MSLSSPKEKMFFVEHGYQMGTLDFIGFILDETEDGAHDISLTTPEVIGTYSYSKISELKLFHSTTTVRELCRAVEKTHNPEYNDKDYSPGFMLVNSYEHKADGSVDLNASTLRGYLISKNSIKAVAGAELEGLFGAVMGTENCTYADAWTYDGMRDGILRSIIVDEWPSSISLTTPTRSKNLVSIFADRIFARFQTRKP